MWCFGACAEKKVQQVWDTELDMCICTFICSVKLRQPIIIFEIGLLIFLLLRKKGGKYLFVPCRPDKFMDTCGLISHFLFWRIVRFELDRNIIMIDVHSGLVVCINLGPFPVRHINVRHKSVVGSTYRSISKNENLSVLQRRRLQTCRVG